MNANDSAWSGLELRHLLALVAVVEAGTFSAAAERLGYTQSAVSQQIANLERIIGERLIEPFDLKGVGFTYNRYLDPARQDDSWLYYPLLKRARRLSTAQRFINKQLIDAAGSSGRKVLSAGHQVSRVTERELRDLLRLIQGKDG